MRILLLVVLSSVVIFSCSDSSSSENTTEVQTNNMNASIVQLDASSFRKAVTDETADIIIIDVRTPSEYSEGAIPNAINIDFLNSNFVKEVKALDRNKEVYLYCAAGGRSSKAARIMEEMGFEKILELKGGLSAYE